MRNLYFLLLVLFGFSCSAPKNYYMFNPTNSDVIKSERVVVKDQTVNKDQKELIEKIETNTSPVILSDEIRESQVAVAEITEEIITNEPVVFSREVYKNMSKTAEITED